MAYFAWTRILTGVDRDETDPTVIVRHNYVSYGEEVSADSLNIDDTEFDALVASAAVRDYAPPELPAGFNGSPLEYLRQQVKQTEELALSQSLGGYNVSGPDDAGRLLGVGVEEGTGPSEDAKPVSLPGGNS